MNNFFVVSHTHFFEDGHEDSKLIGIFAKKSVALKTLEKAKLLEGFRDHPEGFSIEEFKIDQIDLETLNQLKKRH